MKQILTLAALVFATSCFGQDACPNVHDINSNGIIDVEDFLSILGLFADVDVDEDGVWDSQDDCLDASACNYLASPTEPCGYLDALGECGGACEGDGDGDGICDDVDTCVGELDECGVCNGPGPTEVVIEDITILYDSVYLPQLEEWYVYEFGADTTFSFECVPEFTCGEPVGYHGYDYETVQIGDQCWFAENLLSEFYRNGDDILSGLLDNEWHEISNGAVSVYGEGGVDCESYSPDGDACDENWALEQFGRIYNWYAVNDDRGLCPSGWHVPTVDECMSALSQLGGDLQAGYSMKSTSGWSSNNGSNSSGFSGLPGGIRWGEPNQFYHAGNYGFWWTSSNSTSDQAYDFYMNYADTEVTINDNPTTSMFSVRCIQDSE